MRQCVVPTVVGILFDKAQKRIREAGCTVGRTTWVRSPQPGLVVAQSPTGGTWVPLGGAVDLTVGRK